MVKVDTDHLNLLLTRFRGFKSPNDTQKLIIALGEKPNRSIEDNKKLAVLLKAEKKAAELLKARAATNRIINAEKIEARKTETRKKVIWGAALITASKNDPEIAQMMRKLFVGGYVSDRDKDAVKDDFDAITASYTP